MTKDKQAPEAAEEEVSSMANKAERRAPAVEAAEAEQAKAKEQEAKAAETQSK